VLRLLEFIPRVKRIIWTVLRALEVSFVHPNTGQQTVSFPLILVQLFPWIGYLLIIIIYTFSVIGMHVRGWRACEGLEGV
jgi:hypothetical protein